MVNLTVADNEHCRAKLKLLAVHELAMRGGALRV